MTVTRYHRLQKQALTYYNNGNYFAAYHISQELLKAQDITPEQRTIAKTISLSARLFTTTIHPDKKEALELIQIKNELTDLQQESKNKINKIISKFLTKDYFHQITGEKYKYDYLVAVTQALDPDAENDQITINLDGKNNCITLTTQTILLQMLGVKDIAVLNTKNEEEIKKLKTENIFQEHSRLVSKAQEISAQLLPNESARRITRDQTDYINIHLLLIEYMADIYYDYQDISTALRQYQHCELQHIEYQIDVSFHLHASILTCLKHLHRTETDESIKSLRLNEYKTYWNMHEKKLQDLIIQEKDADIRHAFEKIYEKHKTFYQSMNSNAPISGNKRKPEIVDLTGEPKKQQVRMFDLNEEISSDEDVATKHAGIFDLTEGLSSNEEDISSINTQKPITTCVQGLDLNKEIPSDEEDISSINTQKPITTRIQGLDLNKEIPSDEEIFSEEENQSGKTVEQTQTLVAPVNSFNLFPNSSSTQNTRDLAQQETIETLYMLSKPRIFDKNSH